MKEREDKTRNIESKPIELDFNSTFRDLIAGMFEYIRTEREIMKHCLYFDTDLIIYELRDKHSQTKGE